MELLACCAFVLGFAALVMVVHAHRRLDTVKADLGVHTSRLDAHREALRTAFNPEGVER